MKITIYSLLLIFLIACSSELSNQSYIAMTYNIRYDNPDDGNNNWHKRKTTLVEQIKRQKPEILGVQEGLAHQVAYLDSSLIDYNYVGVGREDGKTKGEYAPIFYNSKNWECIKNNTFWLSETPDTISVGWDAVLERICTYALLENKKSKQKIWALNIHFDHQGIKARSNSAKLLLSKIEELEKSVDCPVILTGDFNSTPNSMPIQILTEKLEDSFTSAKDSSEHMIKATFNGFDPKTPPKNKIDYIFTKNLKVYSSEILAESEDNTPFISDHFPVITRFTIEKIVEN